MSIPESALSGDSLLKKGDGLLVLTLLPTGTGILLLLDPGLDSNLGFTSSPVTPCNETDKL